MPSYRTTARAAEGLNLAWRDFARALKKAVCRLFGWDTCATCAHLHAPDLPDSFAQCWGINEAGPALDKYDLKQPAVIYAMDPQEAGVLTIIDPAAFGCALWEPKP